jgi:hypothetical protein
MPSLRDRTYDATARKKFAIVLLFFVTLGVAFFLATQVHRDQVEVPRYIRERHSEPLGTVGMVSSQMRRYPDEAVPVLSADITGDHRVSDATKRAKSVELLGTLDHPEVIPLLGKATDDESLTVRLAAIAALARQGKPAATGPLWDVIDKAAAVERQRAIVALGLTAGDEDIARLLKRIPQANGEEQVLFGWAAGHARRRVQMQAADKDGRLAPRPTPEEPDELRKLHSRILAARARIAAGDDVEEAAQELSELTSVRFDTWDFGHQIAHQVLAVRGPRAIRALGVLPPVDDVEGEDGAANPDVQRAVNKGVDLPPKPRRALPLEERDE